MATIINASTSAGLVQTADTSGNLNLQSNGSTIVAVSSTGAAVTGTLSASGGVTVGATASPTFSAYRSASDGDQAITSATITQILFPTERWDTNSNFASSRFTTTVDGYYLIYAAIDLGASANITAGYIWINKNGSNFVPVYINTTSPSEATFSITGVILFNGSTDYVEIKIRATGTSLVAHGADNDSTYFTASMIRSA